MAVLAACYRYLFDGWDDLGGQEVERFQVVDIAQAEDGLVDAHSGQPGESLNGFSRSSCTIATIACQGEAIKGGFLDLLVWAAH